MGTLNNFHQALLSAEKHQLAKWLPDVFGYYLVALSDQLDEKDLTVSKIRSCVIARSHDVSRGQLITKTDELPFADSSLDCLIYHHQLEGVADLTQTLSEADRVLISHGQVIIIGFNPKSPFHLWQRFTQGKHPNTKHLHSRSSLITALSNNQFTIEESQVFFHKLPMHTSPILEALIAKLWPSSGAIYALRIRKKTPCLIPPPIPCQALAQANI